MQRAAIGLLALAACAGDELATRTLPIIGGETDPGDPAVVYLWMPWDACSGTVISPRVVLTAGHCLELVDPEDIHVVFGMDANGGAVEYRDVASFLSHPTTDLGVVILSAPAPAVPIPLRETPIDDSAIGQPVRVAGFGVTATVGVHDHGTKRQGMTILSEYDEGWLYVGEEGTKTCFGDSGGPAFMLEGGIERLAGITAFGESICERGTSGETRVDVNRRWIDEVVLENDPPGCNGDMRCRADCEAPDPDCACGGDGSCNAGCPEFPEGDPDCNGCEQNGECRVDCPLPDPDCMSPGYAMEGGGGCIVGGGGRPAGLFVFVLGLFALYMMLRALRSSP